MPEPKASVDKVLHALGDPTRRAIVEMLSTQPRSVTYLAEQLKITLTAVGQHLQILVNSGLVRTKKTGRVRTASIDSTGLNVLETWIRQRRNEWDLRLDRLGKLLREIDSKT